MKIVEINKLNLSCLFMEDLELDFLKKTVADSGQVMAMVDKHPQYQELASRVVALYKEIADKALELEKDV